MSSSVFVILESRANDFLIDRDARGYYRVLYDLETWQDLTERLLTKPFVREAYIK